MSPEVLEVGRVVVRAGECNRRKWTRRRVLREIDEEIREAEGTGRAGVWAIGGPVVCIVVAIRVDLAQSKGVLDEVENAAEIVDVGSLFVWAGRRAPPAN